MRDQNVPFEKWLASVEKRMLRRTQLAMIPLVNGLAIALRHGSVIEDGKLT